FAGVLDQTTVGAEVRAERGVATDPFAPRPLHAHRAARPLPDQTALKFCEHAGDLHHGLAVDRGRVKALRDGHEVYALLVEVGDDVGGVGDAADLHLGCREATPATDR